MKKLNIYSRARASLKKISNLSQIQLDKLVLELGWSIYNTKNARKLAELSVADTGIGNVNDKIIKNKKKTLGLLNDLSGIKSTGITQIDDTKGLIEYTKPIGLIGAITPSTNPAATPANHIINAIKGKNAIIICPSPSGYRVSKLLEKYFKKVLKKFKLPEALIQIVDPPIKPDKITEIAKNVDLLMVTGNQSNVRKGYSSGTPCLGVGKGNVPVIIDDTANLNQAVEKIIKSKLFDNSTSCSSENSVIVFDSIYNKFLSRAQRLGGLLIPKKSINNFRDKVFTGGNLNTEIVGKDFKSLQKLFKIKNISNKKKFFLVELTKAGKSEPLSGEKLSLILSLYKVKNLNDAINLSKKILNYQGLGHSAGIHTNKIENAKKISSSLDVARVLVNQSHTFGNGGGIDNYLPYSLSMGCGSWGGNSTYENISFKHYVNKTILVQPRRKNFISGKEMFKGLK